MSRTGDIDVVTPQERRLEKNRKKVKKHYDSISAEKRKENNAKRCEQYRSRNVSRTPNLISPTNVIIFVP